MYLWREKKTRLAKSGAGIIYVSLPLIGPRVERDFINDHTEERSYYEFGDELKVVYCLTAWSVDGAMDSTEMSTSYRQIKTNDDTSKANRCDN